MNSSQETITSNATGNAASPTWAIVPILTIPIAICGILTNTVALATFARNRNLWTPFNVYLVNLSFTNLLYTFVQNPLDIINNIFAVYSASNSACTLYNYANYTLAGGIFHSHVLITVDRIWAMTSPFTYRTYRSVKTSLLFCAGMWIYVHALTLPGLIADAMYYRVPLDAGPCYLNTDPQTTWALAIQFTLYIVPIVVVACAYPYVWYKRRERKKVHGLETHNTLRIQTKASTNSDKPELPGNTETDHSDRPETHSRSAAAAERPTAASGTRKKSSDSFMVLTLLTITNIICWTPANIYYTILLFVPLDTPVYFQTSILLFAFGLILDPVWFILTIRDLREAVVRCVRCRGALH